MIRCPHCSKLFDYKIPEDIEPMFTIFEAAALIPTSNDSLRSFLRFHPEIPRRYRSGRKHRRYRMLTASEVRFIRNHLVKTTYPGTGELVPIIDQENDPKTYPTIEWSKRTPRVAKGLGNDRPRQS